VVIGHNLLLQSNATLSTESSDTSLARGCKCLIHHIPCSDCAGVRVGKNWHTSYTNAGNLCNAASGGRARKESSHCIEDSESDVYRVCTLCADLKTLPPSWPVLDWLPGLAPVYKFLVNKGITSMLVHLDHGRCRIALIF
jgi:hypothetical protein